MAKDTNTSATQSKASVRASTAKTSTATRKEKTNTVKKAKASTPSAKAAAAQAAVNAKAVETAPEAQNVREKEQKAFGVFRSKGKQQPKTLEGILESITQQLIQEQKHSRRWGIFFKLATFIFLFSVLALVVDFGQGNSPLDVVDRIDNGDDAFTAVVEVQGIIAPGEFASSDTVIGHLQTAFEHEGTQGIIIDINSPGGSPVQSGQIYDEIVRLQELYPEIPVYAVISDLGASGAYYIAAAANEIYADKSSLVGSIGVISSGFGFTELMDNLGIERRLVIAGKNKAFLDPFSEEDTQLTEFWQSVLNQTHQQFIDSVVKARGDKLTNDEQIFSGLIYNGEQALELGLIDNLGDKRYVAREIIGYETLRYFNNQDKAWLEWARRFGASLGAALSQTLTSAASQSVLR